ncbi:MAG: hypothetical protein Q9228_004404 [Teloschistes exilis]
MLTRAYYRYHDNADLLKALDNQLAVSKKSEAGKIDFMVYIKITETAALQRVLAALRMYRPVIPFEYGSIKEAVKLADLSFRWRFQPSFVAFQSLWNEPKKICAWREALRQVWSVARDSHERMYRSAGIDVHSQDGPLKLLAHFDSPGLQSTIAQERHEILGKLEQPKKLKTVVPTEPYKTSIPHGPTNREPLTTFGNRIPAKAKLKSHHILDLSTNSAEEHKDTNLPGSQPSAEPLPALPLPKKSRSLDTLRLLFPMVTSDLQGTIQ